MDFDSSRNSFSIILLIPSSGFPLLPRNPSSSSSFPRFEVPVGVEGVAGADAESIEEVVVVKDKFLVPNELLSITAASEYKKYRQSEQNNKCL